MEIHLTRSSGLLSVHLACYCRLTALSAPFRSPNEHLQHCRVASSMGIVKREDTQCSNLQKGMLFGREISLASCAPKNRGVETRLILSDMCPVVLMLHGLNYECQLVIGVCLCVGVIEFQCQGHWDTENYSTRSSKSLRPMAQPKGPKPDTSP